MDYTLTPATVQGLITAATAILIYWIKISMDKGIKEITSTLININSSVSSTQVVHIHPPYSEPIVPSTTRETMVPPESGDEGVNT